MKRYAIILGFLAIVGFGTHLPAAPGVEVGLGVLNTNFPGGSASGKAVFGIWDEWEILPGMLSFRPEVLYQASNPDYINVPLMVSHKTECWHTGIIGFIFLGPEVGFRSPMGPRPRDAFNTFNFAIDGGIGAEYKVLEKLTVGVNWRYSLGLTNQSAIAGAAAAFETRDMYFMAAASYEF